MLANPESDPNLEEADSGKFWNKYGAIYGCLTLDKNKEKLINIYKQGPAFFESLVNE